MEPKRAKELTLRVLSGERLPQADEEWLLGWFRQHSEARDAFLADEETDSLLQCLARLSIGEDDFVQTTLRKVIPGSASASGGDSVAALDAGVAAASLDTSAARPAPSPSRKPKPFRTFRKSLTIVVTCASVVLMVSVGWLVWVGWEHAIREDRAPARIDGDGGADPPRPIPGFAALTETDDARWDSPRSKGDRLGTETLRLRQGAAWIRFDSGTVMCLTGPAVLDLRTGNEVNLDRGSLNVEVPPPAVGFTVTTPVGRVIDLGTEFDVSVEDSGTTTTFVRRGKVAFEPRREGELPGKPIELTAEGLDRAVSSLPDIVAPVLPVSTVVDGEQGRFLGVISAEGKTMEFRTREAFRDCQTRVFKHLRETPAAFSRQWSTMVEASAHSSVGGSTSSGMGSVSMGSSGGATSRSITVSENGKTVSITERSDTGITITIVQTVHGKPKTTVFRAANVAELKKTPEAYELYQRHFGQ